MSLIITVNTNEGIVMGSDSRISFSSLDTSTLGFKTGHYFDTQEKTFLCPNGCGISTCGMASINGKNISGYIKYFINTLINKDTSVTEVANKLKDYIENIDKNIEVHFIVAGYLKVKRNEISQAIYHIITGNNGLIERVHENCSGALWDGESEILTRLIKKLYFTSDPIEVNNLTLNIDNKSVNVGDAIILRKDSSIMFNDNDVLWDMMTLQDAIDFVRYAITTTIETMRFSNVDKTVGGPIDILVITSNESKWIAHKYLK